MSILNQIPLKVHNTSMDTDSLKIIFFFKLQVLHIWNEKAINISKTFLLLHIYIPVSVTSVFPS